jgi:four helix bundle protein
MDVPASNRVLAFMLERMRMYQAAKALAEEVETLLVKARKEAPNTADHLQRAAASVLFNMAEGIGAFRPKVKITSYDISRKEASEVRAGLRHLVIKSVFTEREVERADQFARMCIGMLTNAIISVESRVE